MERVRVDYSFDKTSVSFEMTAAPLALSGSGRER